MDGARFTQLELDAITLLRLNGKTNTENNGKDFETEIPHSDFLNNFTECRM